MYSVKFYSNLNLFSVKKENEKDANTFQFLVQFHLFVLNKLNTVNIIPVLHQSIGSQL